MSCTSKPANARYHTPAYVISSWNETAGRWLPSPTATYSATAVAGECHFICNEGYERDGVACKLVGYPDCNQPDITIGAYTIAACNIGATVAGTGSASYGYYFQRGNNYGFANTGSITTSTSQVNTNGY
jgi:hypothetical protein